MITIFDATLIYQNVPCTIYRTYRIIHEYQFEYGKTGKFLQNIPGIYVLSQS